MRRETGYFMTSSTKKRGAADPERIYDLLLGARTADLCTVHFKDGERTLGRVCSGTRSPTLGKNIATALVVADAAEEASFQVDIRGRSVAAQRTALPFYRKKES